MIEEIWSKLSSEPDFEGCVMKQIEPPRPDIHTINTCRKLCRQNRCGSFKTNWGCPPGVGSEEDCLGQINEYDKAVIIYHRYENIDFKDLELIEKRAAQHQQVGRRFANAMRAAGYDDVLPLADGGCKYCPECSYPDEPCRNPTQAVPSVSGFGIIMEEYLESQGINFKFEDNAFTLYALVLFNCVHKGL